MDYDSSTKFISSLAKFLQSLCNGYVEFDNGVEVIGHIYLSVDTGKKIDYILNEKVCKTDENSVTFISNSFHAQPAEKPKPNNKKGRNDQSEEKTASVVELDINDDSINQIEPRSTNSGTIGRHPNANQNFQSSSPSLGKRPFSPHSKASSYGSKRGRKGSQDHSFGINPEEGNASISSPIPDPLRVHPQSLSGLPPDSNSQQYELGFNPSVDNSVTRDSDERDIKPSMDTDVTFVKEEFTPSSCSIAGDEVNQTADGSFSSLYQSYSGGGESSDPPYGHQNSSRLGFGGAGERSDLYDPTMSSQMEGNDDGTDPSVVQGGPGKWPLSPSQSDHRIETSLFHCKPYLADVKLNAFNKQLNYQKNCRKCGITFRSNLEMNIHKKECTGKRHLTCNVCFKVLSRYDALAEHLRGIHGIGTKVACRFCGKSFKYKPQVYQHQSICPQKIMGPGDFAAKYDLPHVSESESSCAKTLSPLHHSSESNDVKPVISFPYDPKGCS